MPADVNPFRVLSTPLFERDFRKVSHGRPSLVEAVTEMQAILREGPSVVNGVTPNTTVPH
jgi:hypothetical protein